MDLEDRLRLDLERATTLVETLVEIRFKLLAFVPTIAGATVGLLGGPRTAVELMAIGTLGLVATLGLLSYDERISRIAVDASRRARMLEARLDALDPAGPAGGAGTGGGIGELLGRLNTGHQRSLAMVYGAALSGWSYLVAWGALSALGVPDARGLGALAGAATGMLVIATAGRTGLMPRPT